MKHLNFDKIFELVFGTPDIEFIFVGIIFAIFGAILSLLLDSNTRNVESKRTPREYSYLFLIKDNSKRMVITIIIISVFMRFTKELLGIEPSVYWSFFIGFSSDKLSEYLKTVKKKFFENEKTYNQLPTVNDDKEIKTEDEIIDSNTENNPL